MMYVFFYDGILNKVKNKYICIIISWYIYIYTYICIFFMQLFTAFVLFEAVEGGGGGIDSSSTTAALDICNNSKFCY